MREIPLTQGFVALVDDDDYEWVNDRGPWHVVKHVRLRYAAHREGLPDQLMTYMHRLIMEPPTGLVVDHKDDNGLNCQRYNMRICTHRQNTMRQRTFGQNYLRGVHKDRGRWEARIGLNGRQVHLGCFGDQETAARAYDVAALKYFGEFARLNFPETPDAR